MTKIYLGVSDSDLRNYLSDLQKSEYILASFYYVRRGGYNYQKTFKNFMLDSGAFSFIYRKGHELANQKQIKSYLNNYIDYINHYDIKYFAELDIDSIIGHENVKRLRKELEQRTNKKCIPIWHHSRGKDEFIRLCKEYDYIGIGGIAGGEELSKHREVYRDLNLFAKKFGTKVHGMGFTPQNSLNSYMFYSTDSTSWTTGGRYKKLYVFRHGGMTTVDTSKYRLKNYKKLTRHNLGEWLKYQKNQDIYEESLW